MTTKTYKYNGMGGKITTYVPVNGKSIQITFKRCHLDLIYTTSDAEIQKAIEESTRFKNGTVTLDFEVEEADNEKVDETTEEQKNDVNDSEEQTSIPEVNTPQKVKEILRGEPYNIAFQAMKTIEQIKAKADELGLSFPAVKWE